MKSKKCKKCGIEKSISDFNANKRHKVDKQGKKTTYNYYYSCRSCELIRLKSLDKLYPSRHRVNKDNGEVFWITELNKFKKGQKVKDLNLWLGPYLINSLLYNISYFGELKIVSPMTGDLLSTESLGVKGIMVPPIILSNAVFIMDENSNVFQFD